MRETAKEITNVYGERGSQAQDILNRAGVGNELILIEEYFKDELLSGDIENLKK